MDGQATDWSVIHAQIALFFADRMPEYHPPLPHIKDILHPGVVFLFRAAEYAK